MKTIFLVRHCKAAGQAPEAPLTDEGQKQAEQLVYFFKDEDIEAIYSSPFVRALDTIKPLSESINRRVITDERLAERVLSAAALEDWMSKLEKTYLDMDLSYEGGESSNEATARGMSVIHDIMSRPESNVLIVTHGALMSLILRAYNPQFGFDEWKKLSNPDVYRLELDPVKGAVLERVWEPGP